MSVAGPGLGRGREASLYMCGMRFYHVDEAFFDERCACHMWFNFRCHMGRHSFRLAVQSETIYTRGGEVEYSGPG